MSDNIGREYTMAIAFGLGAVAYWLLGSLGTAPWAFVLFAALIFLTWGEIFSLFPSTCTDTFRAEIRDREPQPALYGEGHLGVPGAGRQRDQDARPAAGTLVFVVTALMNIVVVALALFVLKPMRARQMAKG